MHTDEHAMSFLKPDSPPGTYGCDQYLDVLFAGEAQRWGLAAKRGEINRSARIALIRAKQQHDSVEHRPSGAPKRSSRPSDPIARVTLWHAKTGRLPQNLYISRFCDAVLEVYRRYHEDVPPHDVGEINRLAVAALRDLGFSSPQLPAADWIDNHAEHDRGSPAVESGERPLDPAAYAAMLPCCTPGSKKLGLRRARWIRRRCIRAQQRCACRVLDC
jgi:hypothetical protein